MVLLHLSAPSAADHHSSPIDDGSSPIDDGPIDVEQLDRFVGQLFTEIESLRRERDCLRSALVDAGFSLRAVRIARYAHETSTLP